MGSRRRDLRRLFPKEQALLDGVFDETLVDEIRDAQDDEAFDLVDTDIETSYECPRCRYEWSGSPKPNQKG